MEGDMERRRKEGRSEKVNVIEYLLLSKAQMSFTRVHLQVHAYISPTLILRKRGKVKFVYSTCDPDPVHLDWGSAGLVSICAAALTRLSKQAIVYESKAE